MAVPKLRFKRDDGSTYPEWTPSVMGDFYTERREAGNDQLPVLSVSIHTGVSNDELDEAELGKRVKRIEDKSAYRVAHTGDLVFNMMRAWQGTVGCAPTNGMVSPAYIVAVPDDRIDPCFMNYYVQTRKIIDEFNMLSYGVTDFRKRLYWDSFSIARVYAPSIEEQKRIAAVLLEIDAMISACQDEVENLEQQKKAVMQKLFSQETRFKREDETDFPQWKKQPILSLCTRFIDGDWIESKDQSNHGIRLIQTGNIGNGYFNPKEDKKRFISVDTFSNLRCKEVLPGVILISRLPDPAGRACIIPKTDERMITAVDCTIVRTNSCLLLSTYLVQFYQSVQHFSYVNSMLAGGTRQRITRKLLEDECILLPSIEEQQKIAIFLSEYDTAIQAAEDELSKWQELKKGLLQQMFI